MPLQTSPAPSGISGPLDASLAVADLRVLVMCLYQATGDPKWLAQPFVPTRDVRLIADPTAGFDHDTANAIRGEARRVFSTPRQLAVPDPTGDELLAMMSHCLGEAVPAEYAPMIADDFGHTRDADRRAAAPSIRVMIIGAGVSGLCLAARLDADGIDYEVLEKNHDLGGTWLENVYPGCGVDTPNHFYSYSFAPNPAWSRYFSQRPEIHDYLKSVAAGTGIGRRITFGHAVIGARWDSVDAQWHVRIRDADGQEHMRTADVVVSATGHFNDPITPEVDGLSDFAGPVVHTARWPSELNLTGRHLSVIGTGASAMQLVPTIADQVASLTVYQRSPQWVRPVEGYGDPVDPAAARLFTDIPNYGKWYRFTQLWRYGDGLLRFLRKDPDWPEPDRALNRVNDRHREEMTTFIADKLAGHPELIRQCTPNYPPFAKRILIDNRWYDTLRRPHVTLVTEPIKSVTRDGIRTADGDLHPADTIVLATGFNVTSLASRMHITGRDDHALAEDWASENPTAYLGMTVPKFPNFFIMYGPNTNMGHGGSGMWLAETQTHYITSVLAEMASAQIRTLEPTEQARAEYTQIVDELHEDLVWTHPGVSTYYRNKAGQVRSPMPFRLVDYWHMTRRPDLSQFHVSHHDPDIAAMRGTIMHSATQKQLLDRIQVHRLDGKGTDLAATSMVVDTSVYTKPDRFAAEQAMLAKTPTIVGLSGLLPESGRFATVVVGGRSVIVTRLPDGTVSAMLNACRHRGAEIKEGCGSARRLICPYHGWSYDLDGTAAHRRRDEYFADTPAHDLITLPVHERDGLIWVCADPAGDMPEEPLRGAEEELRPFDLASYVLFAQTEFTRPMNWKLAVDTFCEAYHVGTLHRQTIASLIYSDFSVFDAMGPHGRMIAVRKSIDDLDEGSTDLLPHATILYFLVPNTVLVHQQDHVELYQSRPGRHPAEAHLTVSLYVPREHGRSDSYWQKNFDLLVSVTDTEDFTTASGMQRTFDASSLDKVVFGRNEPALQHFHTSLDRLIDQDVP